MFSDITGVTGIGTRENPPLIRIIERKKKVSIPPPILTPGVVCPMLDTSGTTPVGIGTAYPLAMSYTNWLAAVSQHQSSPTFCPLRTHTATLVVTPGCSGATSVTGAITSNTAQRVTGGCYMSKSVLMISGSSTGSSGGCPPDYPDSTLDFGATGVVTETVDFGNAVQDSNGVVWVLYSLVAAATWTCNFSGCFDDMGNPCTVPPASSCPPPGSTTGDVCTNVLGLTDPFSAPCASSDGIVLTGTGWTTGVTSPTPPTPPSIGLSVCYDAGCATGPVGCVPCLTFTY